MKPDFDKMPGGLVPAIVQDPVTSRILMLGYMNAEALARTLDTGCVWFYSRSRQRLWMKGESSGNVLRFVAAREDCDGDAILVQASPAGPVCHTGADSCFSEPGGRSFIPALELLIAARRTDPQTGSYTASLFAKGINAIAQKVGEEAVELIIEAKDQDPGRFVNEAADLLFHYLVLLQAKGLRLEDVGQVLQARHAARART